MTTCPKCGFNNSSGHQYCGNCGAPLQTTPSINQPITNNQPPQKSNNTAVIVGVFLIFTIIGVAIWAGSLLSTPGIIQNDFVVVIDSDTTWSGAIGGLSGSTTHSGTGHASFTIHDSIVSACIQKQTADGYLTVKIERGNQVINSQTTTAAYGVVTVTNS